MKTPAFPSRSRRAPGAGRAAFTLPELMITLTLFLMLVGGILSSHLFGLRMSGMTEAKLSASTSAREALGRITGEIRSCDSTWVGNVRNGLFTEIGAGRPQIGSALLVQPTTNAAQFIVYFVNADDHTFRRTTSQMGSTTILARSVTNDVVFYSQDYAGNVLTNKLNNRVIHLCLEFFQPQPFQPVPDYYKIETSVTRRARE
jgi:prepilin-type N-terminal cleavage/methylation domain-containing protein